MAPRRIEGDFDPTDVAVQDEAYFDSDDAPRRRFVLLLEGEQGIARLDLRAALHRQHLERAGEGCSDPDVLALGIALVAARPLVRACREQDGKAAPKRATHYRRVIGHG